MVHYFLGWVQTLTIPLVMDQALTTSVETYGTLRAATQKTGKDGWSLLPSLDGQITELSVSVDLGLLRSTQQVYHLRYDPWVRFLLVRCHGHFVVFEAKRYVIEFDIIVRRALSFSTENKARSQA
jgi:hypothetical protein